MFIIDQQMAGYEVEYEGECPKCGHTPMHSEICQECCDTDGIADLYYEDPLRYGPGSYVVCSGCKGYGVVRWCPGCGAYIAGRYVIDNSPVCNL